MSNFTIAENVSSNINNFKLESIATKHPLSLIEHRYQNKYTKFYGSILNKNMNSKTNLCNLPNLLFVSHHKTGGYFKHYIPEFMQSCSMNLSVIWDNAACQFNSTESINKLLNDNYNILFLRNPRCNQLILSKQIIENYLILFMVRAPIEHILSAYNYHAAGQEGEILQALHKKYFAQCFRNVFNSNEVLIKHKTSMYKEYVLSYSDWHNHTLLLYGLYLEFTRYINCIWPNINALYQSLKENDDKINFIIVRFEWFHDVKKYKYKESLMHLLKQIGIYSNKNVQLKFTKNVLASHSKRYSVVLLRNLLKWDWNNFNKWGVQNLNHTTKGKYNHDLQVKLLLTKSSTICLKLKGMTINFDFEWRYDQLCSRLLENPRGHK
eukprot:229327_1